MLESLKEYFSSTINTAAQRVSNPVFGAFSLSWCAFNWKSILYLFLSDSGIIDKITYISDNSSWKTVALYPCISVVLLCGGLPWINNLISAWQSKPLDNNDSIENHRKAKRIVRATRLQRLQAKHDVTYDKVKTGAEKDIQAMKEEIIKSKDSMGELTAELKSKDEELAGARSEISTLNSSLKEITEALTRLNKSHKTLKNEYDEYKINNPVNATLNSLHLRNGQIVSSFVNQNGLVGLSGLTEKGGIPDQNYKTWSGFSAQKDKDKD
ncbi:hypothetical protein [Leclercia tamurae]|uniref:hypothetical protein n=1 Tax=Leclercia tamurae TaxID=2926467 RepID=UPI0036F46FCD